MILKLLQDWFEKTTAEFNSEKIDSLHLQSVNIIDTDFEMIPFNQSDLYYQLTIESISNENSYRAEEFDNINVKIDLFFSIPAKDYSHYQTLFDRYIWGLRRFMKNNSHYNIPYNNTDISTSLFLQELKSVEISNANNFEGAFYKPTFNIQFMTCDNINNEVLSTEELV